MSESLSGVNSGLDSLSQAFNQTANLFGGILDTYHSYQDIKLERDLLRKELKDGQSLRWQLTKLKTENQRLRQLLSLRPLEQYDIMTAEVISNKLDNWFETIIVDKGENQGIQIYMPVIANQIASTKSSSKGSRYSKIIEGAVGKIIQVNSNSSRVLLINSLYSKLGVLIKKSGHWALLEGQSPHSEMPLLRYIKPDVNLKEGDKIITLGSDGIFPKGITVGSVYGKPKKLSGLQQARVKLNLDYRRLDYVYIIKKDRDKLQKEIQQKAAESNK